MQKRKVICSLYAFDSLVCCILGIQIILTTVMGSKARKRRQRGKMAQQDPTVYLSRGCPTVARLLLKSCRSPWPAWAAPIAQRQCWRLIIAVDFTEINTDTRFPCTYIETAPEQIQQATARVIERETNRSGARKKERVLKNPHTHTPEINNWQLG